MRRVPHSPTTIQNASNRWLSMSSTAAKKKEAPAEVGRGAAKARDGDPREITYIVTPGDLALVGSPEEATAQTPPFLPLLKR